MAWSREAAVEGFVASFAQRMWEQQHGIPTGALCPIVRRGFHNLYKVQTPDLYKVSTLIFVSTLIDIRRHFDLYSSAL